MNDTQRFTLFRKDLLRWFAENRRPLPWRADYTPYRTWIAEVMMQQTQMDRGVQYFLRWMDRFPDVAAVAAAPEEDLLKAWEGLGYYRRARNIQAAAQVIMERHGGTFPTSYADILALPEGTKVIIMAPLVELQKGTHLDRFKKLKAEGFVRVRVDGQLYGMEDIPALDKNKKHNIEIVVDRLVIKEDIHRRLTDSVETAAALAGGLVVINIVGEDRDILFSQNYACEDCGISIEELTPRMFSFNNPFGACPTCTGLGSQLKVCQYSAIKKDA